jgi:hypothetical protein
MIRGAIAFGLSIRIEDKDNNGKVIFKDRGLTITTILGLVIVTTVIFGSFMPIVSIIIFKTNKTGNL